MRELGDYAPGKAGEKLYRALRTISALVTATRAKNIFQSQVNSRLSNGGSAARARLRPLKITKADVDAVLKKLRAPPTAAITPPGNAPTYL